MEAGSRYKEVDPIKLGEQLIKDALAKGESKDSKRIIETQKWIDKLKESESDKAPQNMGAESKYYTPDISEFHVGFIHDVRWINDPNDKDSWGDWLTDVEMDADNFYLPSDYCQIRVKYLDNEDIESLGWNDDENNFFRIQDEKHRNYQLLFLDGRCHIDLIRYKEGGFRYDTSIFIGTIKNKSELKKIMQTTGIIK